MRLRIPALLDELIAQGRWPRTVDEELAQNSHPLASPERVRALAPDEAGAIYFNRPPLVRIGRRDDPRDFYNWPSSDPAGIDHDLAVGIGDFGLGSDAPIVLDYRVDAENPRVMRLRYDAHGPLAGKWVVMAPTFAAFAEALELSGRAN
jgi:hypothetical protein